MRLLVPDPCCYLSSALGGGHRSDPHLAHVFVRLCGGDPVHKTLTGTVTRCQLSVTEKLRENRILIGRAYKRRRLEPNVAVCNQLNILGVQEIQLSFTSQRTVKCDWTALEHEVLETSIRNIRIGVANIGRQQSLVGFVLVLACDANGRLVVTN